MHIDLFSGIGGFTLACKWAGIQTEVFCEKDERCQEFLRRTYPGIPIVSDIREFDGTKWRGRFILTAGVPCQPASRAGKQGGKADNRWLWPDALRIVSEARPDWVLFENPLGINDVGLDGILADLEGLDYEVAPPLIIPACAVNSPQLRNRYWIVANAQEQRLEGRGDGSEGQPAKGVRFLSAGSSQSDLADSSGERRQQDPGSPPKNEGEYARRSTASDNQPSGDVQSDVAHAQGRQDNGRGNGDLAEAEGCGGSGDTADRVAGQGDMADTGEQRCGPRGAESAGQQREDEVAESYGDMADTHEMRWRGRTGESRPAGGREFEDRDFWSNSIWLPCADGKLRRAPDDSFGVVDGLHRSVLAGLGNSIVPQIAYQIIKAIVESR